MWLAYKTISSTLAAQKKNRVNIDLNLDKKTRTFDIQAACKYAESASAKIFAVLIHEPNTNGLDFNKKLMKKIPKTFKK